MRWHYSEDKTIKEQDSRRQKIAIKFLQITGDREARNQEGVPQAISVRKETTRIELMLISIITVKQ